MANGDLYTQAQNTDLIYNMTLAQYLLEMMNKNLANIQKPITQKKRTVANTNLFAIASQEYGDPSKWKIIADANNLTDVEITDVVELIIPLVTNTNTNALNVAGT